MKNRWEGEHARLKSGAECPREVVEPIRAEIFALPIGYNLRCDYIAQDGT
jgi:hypothetical protein